LGSRAKKRGCGARVAEPLAERAIAHFLREHLMARLYAAALLAVVLASSLAIRSSLAEEVKCEGAITAIDGDIVIVKDAMDEHQMKIEPATKIMFNGKPGSSMDLKVGQKVKCVCEKKGEEMICTTLVVNKDINQR
jgi:hypothetical protein